MGVSPQVGYMGMLCRAICHAHLPKKDSQDEGPDKRPVMTVLRRNVKLS
jgi:hypothetical protein